MEGVKAGSGILGAPYVLRSRLAFTIVVREEEVDDGMERVQNEEKVNFR
jgi:hypothetical protein